MKELSDSDRREIREEVRREFPEDQMMQEIHFVRRLHQAQTEKLSLSDKIAFYRSAVEQGSA